MEDITDQNFEDSDMPFDNQTYAEKYSDDYEEDYEQDIDQFSEDDDYFEGDESEEEYIGI